MHWITHTEYRILFPFPKKKASTSQSFNIQTKLPAHQKFIYLLQVLLKTYKQADIGVHSDHYKQTIKT